MPTIQEVAEIAGVSAATVSRTFASPDLLNKDTRDRILAVADRLNYRPRRSATSKGIPQHNLIGFQFFASSQQDSLQANAFYAAVLGGAQAEAAALEMHLVLHTTYPRQLAREFPKMVRERAVAGMLLVGIGADETHILDSFSQYIPQIVLVDNHDATGRFDCVLSDGAGGGFQATRSLFERGHRRIGFVLSDRKVKTFQDRLQGYFGARYEAGLPLDPALILAADSIEDTYARLPAFLRFPQRPTALVASNDLAASAVMQTCRSLGIDIPRDLSLIGFDDLDFSSHTFPSLSTVRVDKESLGRRAVRRLHARLQADAGQSVEPPVNLVLPVSLVRRQSCRALEVDG